MKVNNNMFGLTKKELQSYVDKTLSKFLSRLESRFARRNIVEGLQNQIHFQNKKLEKLEEFFKVEYVKETTEGYVKIKKTKKK